MSGTVCDTRGMCGVARMEEMWTVDGNVDQAVRRNSRWRRKGRTVRREEVLWKKEWVV